MGKKNISQERIIEAFILSAFEKSAGATSLADISDILEIKKASLYNHFESREAMYDATLEHCKKEIGAVSFLPEKTLDSIIKNDDHQIYCVENVKYNTFLSPEVKVLNLKDIINICLLYFRYYL